MNKDLHPMFQDLASVSREGMHRFAHVQSIKTVRQELDVYARNYQKQPNWEKFQKVMSQGYFLLDMPDDEVLAEELDVLAAGLLYDYMNGFAVPSPQRAANMCSAMEYLLQIKEASLFIDALEQNKRLQKKKTATPV